tara:strand:+ start:2376 stop:2816 length:441 start_codon:yes stop_codon:yes gene_type:complete
MADTFNEDLPYGEEAEKAVLKRMKKKYALSHKVEGNFKYYDLFCPEKNISVEVKRDEPSNESGNCFVEYKCNGYDSGINTSRANYWAICDGFDCIWINKDTLKTISERHGKKWDDTPEGSHCPIKGYLVPKNCILEYAELVTKLPL